MEEYLDIFANLLRAFLNNNKFEVKVVAGFYINEYLKQYNSDVVIGMPRKPIPKIEGTIQKVNAPCISSLVEIWRSPRYCSRKPIILLDKPPLDSVRLLSLFMT